jgi:micrococcal nuclease
MIQQAYVYKAKVARVIDGDTFEMDVDLGFHIDARLMIRLRGFFAAERNTPDGQRAKLIADALLMSATHIVIETEKTKRGDDVQTFARYVADVWIDGEPLAAKLAAVLGNPAGTGAEQ